MAFLSVLPFVHDVLRHHIQAGDTVLDGTAGNGHDTLLLAQLVGEQGKVFAFDIQETALQNTTKRLAEHQLLHRVNLIHTGHEHLAEFIQIPLAAAVFNFGYLPRGNHTITTQTHTSIMAFEATLSLLKPHGIVCAVLYHGHDAGKPETAALLDLAQHLPQDTFRVLRYEFINQKNCPPIVLAVEKIK